MISLELWMLILRQGKACLPLKGCCEFLKA
jgi:hypothetical protein